MGRSNIFKDEKALFAKATISYYISIRGYRAKEETTIIAKILGVSLPTARAKLNNPKTLTLGDMGRISQSLKIPREEFIKAI